MVLLPKIAGYKNVQNVSLTNQNTYVRLLIIGMELIEALAN